MSHHIPQVIPWFTERLRADAENNPHRFKLFSQGVFGVAEHDEWQRSPSWLLSYSEAVTMVVAATGKRAAQGEMEGDETAADRKAGPSCVVDTAKAFELSECLFASIRSYKGPDSEGFSCREWTTSSR
jgi:hypothetical protein